MEWAGGYRRRIDQHIEPVFADGARDELSAEHARARRGHGRWYRRSVRTYARGQLSPYALTPNRPNPITTPFHSNPRITPSRPDD